jgi:hypothetical protein
MSLSPFDNIWGCVQKFALEHHLAIIVKGPSAEVQAQLYVDFDLWYDEAVARMEEEEWPQ